MEDPKKAWELPWSRLEVPLFQDARVKQWYIQSAFLLANNGYFTSKPMGGLQTYTMLVREDREPTTVMSTLPVECESNAPHVAAAKGNIVIMGAGMGLVLYNILKKPEALNVVVVERDPSVIQLLREATNLESWTGYDKLTIVNSDAFQFIPEYPIDYLYVDIWDDLGDPLALSQTQEIQRNVNASSVSWWTQEIEFMRWMNRKGFELPPTPEQFLQWAQEIQLPVIEQKNPDYLRLIHQVSKNFPSLTSIETLGHDPEPEPTQDEPVRAMPEGMLDSTKMPDGTELVLCKRGSEFGILVEGRELMSSEAYASERHLALLACEPLAGRKRPRVVIGGLGMGFTLRAALDILPKDAEVIVVELIPAVVEWNRGPLGTLTDHALDDARVHVEVADLCDWIKQSNDGVDVIMLDIDNGPEALSMESNRAVYSDDALARVIRMLNSGGILATWSVNRVRDFERRLDDAGFHTEIHRIPGADAEGFPEHIIYISHRAK